MKNHSAGPEIRRRMEFMNEVCDKDIHTYT